MTDNVPLQTKYERKFGFYSLEGKILYAEHEIEAYLRWNYHPPFKEQSTSIAPADFLWPVGAISSLEDETGISQIKCWLMSGWMKYFL